MKEIGALERVSRKEADSHCTVTLYHCVGCRETGYLSSTTVRVETRVDEAGKEGNVSESPQTFSARVDGENIGELLAIWE